MDKFCQDRNLPPMQVIAVTASVALLTLSSFAQAHDSFDKLRSELLSVGKVDRSKAVQIIQDIGKIQSPEAVDFLLSIAAFPPASDPQDTGKKGKEIKVEKPDTRGIHSAKIMTLPIIP